MAGIIERFKDIMAANIHALLDKAEDPEKMIDQYLRNFERDLGTVKAETAAVIAEEKSAQRRLAECEEEIKTMDSYAKKALLASNEEDARAFLKKKDYLKNELSAYQQSYQIAKTNAEKMRLMHDKLNAEIEDLNARRGEIKAKMKVAKAKQQVSTMTSKIGIGNSASIFEAMNEKAQRLIDEADAMAELNTPKEDTIDALTLKYSESNETNPVVEDDLERLKKELGL
ncbi:MAG: PspA/IM30 family protein [Caldisericia bacterium]|nr:PspA/IM30 family protein [Caldisericia bacterium]MDD4614308.1 PspA/IM30 family protein [Caldisericia bacterium]